MNVDWAAAQRGNRCRAHRVFSNRWHHCVVEAFSRNCLFRSSCVECFQLIWIAPLFHNPGNVNVALKSTQCTNNSMHSTILPRRMQKNGHLGARKSLWVKVCFSSVGYYTFLFVRPCRKVKYLNMKGSLVDEHTVRALSKAGKEVSFLLFI